MKRIYILFIIIMIFITGCNSKSNNDIENVLNTSNAKISDLEDTIINLEEELYSIKGEYNDLKNEYNTIHNEYIKSLEKNLMDIYEEYYTDGIEVHKLDDNYALIVRIANSHKKVLLFNLSSSEHKVLDIPFWGINYDSYEDGIIKFYHDGYYPTGGCNFGPYYSYYNVLNDEIRTENVFIPLEEHINVGAHLNECELYEINVINDRIEFKYRDTINTVYAGGDNDIVPNLFIGTNINDIFYIEMVNVVITQETEEQLIKELENISFIKSAEFQTKDVSDYEVDNFLFLELVDKGYYSCDFDFGNSFTIEFN